MKERENGSMQRDGWKPHMWLFVFIRGQRKTIEGKEKTRKKIIAKGGKGLKANNGADLRGSYKHD